MVEPTSDTGPSTQPPRRAEGARLVPILATVLLAAAGCVTSFFGLLMPLAAVGCDEPDSRLICTSGGQLLVFVLPVLSAGVGVTLAIVGCTRWPQDSWAGWLIAGFAVTIIGFFICYAIASAEPRSILDDVGPVGATTSTPGRGSAGR